MLELWEPHAYLLCPFIHFSWNLIENTIITKVHWLQGSWVIIVRVVTRLLAGRSEVQILAGEIYFISKTFHICSGAHPVSYSLDTRGSFPMSKLVRMWGWSLTYILCWGSEWVELYLHSLYMSSWRVWGKLHLHLHQLKFVVKSSLLMGITKFLHISFEAWVRFCWNLVYDTSVT
jgi:hypothetical protein